MLEPRHRTLLLDALRPPDAYHLEFALGTTFSLDLVTLLTVPLAFTWFDRGLGEEELPIDAVEVIESIRRYAMRVALFCHAGRIAIPRGRLPQLAFMENRVFECLPPRGLFHPKVWVLRFVASDRPVMYRFLCLTRNLTFSRSWDTLLSLDGPLADTSVSRNRPLADFVAALPRLASRPVAPDVEREIERMAQDLARVAFDKPDGVDELTFWPIGLEGHPQWPFRHSGARALVISPFLTADLLERFSKGRRGCVLVSSPEALERLERRPEGYSEFYVLDDRAVGELDEQPADQPHPDGGDIVELAGLHAKCYVAEDGARADVWTGSANATGAAFSGNIEFLVQLSGPRRHLGVNTLLSEGGDPSVTLRSLLKRVDAVATAGPDEEGEALAASLEAVRRALSAAQLEAHVSPHPDGRLFDVALRPRRDATLRLDADSTVWTWPIGLTDEHKQSLSSGAATVATFHGVTFESLTSFFAFRLSGMAGHSRAPDFVMNVPLIGAPEDRPQRILKSLVRDRARLLKLLMLVLADEGLDPLVGASIGAEPRGDTERAQPGSESPLFEALLAALDRAPERLDDVARLLASVGEGDGDGQLFPEGFHRIWGPIWEARCRRRACQTA